MKIKEVIAYLDVVFHPEYQEEYDNSGFLVGNAEADYRGSLIALDLTPSLIDEAIRKKCNLIVTHHPCIFGNLKQITNEDTLGRMIIQLIKNGICAYAAHTNLDNLKNGVNGILCQKLGISNTHILKPISGHEDIGAGMIGYLEQTTDSDTFLKMVKTKLTLPFIRTNGMTKDKIRKVAVCGGAGSFLIPDAIKEEVDILLTGDLKYHDFQKADNKIILGDIGHYESEQFAKEIIYCTILEKFGKFACAITESNNGFTYYI